MFALPDSLYPNFYIYLVVIQYLGVLIPFTLFKAEALRDASIAPSHILPNNSGFIRAFDIICRRLEVSIIVGMFFFLLWY